MAQVHAKGLRVDIGVGYMYASDCIKLVSGFKVFAAIPFAKLSSDQHTWIFLM